MPARSERIYIFPSRKGDPGWMMPFPYWQSRIEFMNRYQTREIDPGLRHPPTLLVRVYPKYPIPNNIAKGHKRGSTAEHIRFLGIAAGSAGELETQFLLAGRLGYHEQTVPMWQSRCMLKWEGCWMHSFENS